MVIISLYHKEVGNGRVYIRSKEASVCPVCFSSLRVIGSLERKVIETNGSTAILYNTPIEM